MAGEHGVEAGRSEALEDAPVIVRGLEYQLADEVRADVDAGPPPRLACEPNRAG